MVLSMDILFFNIFISLALKIKMIGEKATLYTLLEHLLWPIHRNIWYMHKSAQADPFL